MTDNQRRALEAQLSKYEAIGLNPEQVAEVLGVTRRYVDTLLNEGKLEHFVLDPTKQLKQKRVTKQALISYIQKNTI